MTGVNELAEKIAKELESLMESNEVVDRVSERIFDTEAWQDFEYTIAEKAVRKLKKKANIDAIAEKVVQKIEFSDYDIELIADRVKETDEWYEVERRIAKEVIKKLREEDIKKLVKDVFERLKKELAIVIADNIRRAIDKILEEDENTS